MAGMIWLQKLVSLTWWKPYSRWHWQQLREYHLQSIIHRLEEPWACYTHCWELEQHAFVSCNSRSVCADPQFGMSFLISTSSSIPKSWLMPKMARFNSPVIPSIRPDSSKVHFIARFIMTNIDTSRRKSNFCNWVLQIHGAVFSLQASQLQLLYNAWTSSEAGKRMLSVPFQTHAQSRQLWFGKISDCYSSVWSHPFPSTSSRCVFFQPAQTTQPKP